MDWKGDDIDAESVVEPEAEVEGEAGGPEALAEEKMKKLRAELEACRKEKQEYMDGWQRAKADYVNALKRFTGDAKTAELRGKIRAVETLLPAFDALERAKAAGEVPEGFLAIAKQLEAAFAALGLEELGRVGEKFDPALHEAVEQEKVDSQEKDDIITAVLGKGWRVGEHLMRAAKVRVGHFSQP